MTERNFEAEVFEKVQALMDHLTTIRDSVKEIGVIVKEKIKPRVDEHERQLDLNKKVLTAQNLLVYILHQRVKRIEEYMKASPDDFLKGNVPEIGITDEENEQLADLLRVVHGG